MSSTVENLRIFSNENFKLSLEITDVNGDVPDFTGAAAAMAIRETPESEEAILYIVSIVNGEIVLDAETGILTIDVPFSTVSSWEFTTGYYDVVIMYSEDDQDTVLGGRVKLVQGITRPPL